MVIKGKNGAVVGVIVSLLAVLGHAGATKPAPGGMLYRVSESRVAAALASRDISVQPDQVEFLASVKSNHPEPELEIEHLQTAGRRALLARIRCREAGECLPFLVVVHFSNSQDAQAMLEGQHAGEVPPRRTGNPPRPVWIVRTGQQATFVLEGKDMRATTPVICLQNGRKGESIRVSSVDRKRIMVGEIVGPGLLHGTLWGN